MDSNGIAMPFHPQDGGARDCRFEHGGCPTARPKLRAVFIQWSERNWAAQSNHVKPMVKHMYCKNVNDVSTIWFELGILGWAWCYSGLHNTETQAA